MEAGGMGLSASVSYIDLEKSRPNVGVEPLSNCGWLCYSGDMDNHTKVPEGSTHFHYFYGHVTFWCVRATEYSREQCKWYGHWHYWDRGAWVEDRTASSRGFQPIAEYCEATYGV